MPKSPGKLSIVAAQQFAFEKYKLDRAHELELNRLTAQYEHESLKILSYLNGGAAAAYVAFVGNMARFAEFKLNCWHVAPVLFWSLGLVAATASLWLMYESQVKFTQAYHGRRRAEEKRRFAGVGAYATVTDPSKNAADYEADADKKREKGTAWKGVAKLVGFSAVLFFVAGLAAAIPALTS